MADQQSTPAEAGFEDAATEIWHRFAPGHRIEWEDEPRQSEYRDAARAAVFAFLSSPHALADIASALTKLRHEIVYLRAGLSDLIEDDTRPGPEMRDVAQAVLDGTFRRAGT